jgi:uncharacterized membrane protein
MPEKAIWIGGHTLSWDARCSGIYIGVGIGVLYQLIVCIKAMYLPRPSILLFAGVLFIPLFLDVFTVQYGVRQASNDLRFLTGLLFGQALSIYLYPAFIRLAVAVGREKAAIDSWYKFAGLLVITAGAFLTKYFQHLAAYYILELLAVFGCLSLFAGIIWSLFKIIGGRIPGNKTDVLT